MDKQIQSVPAHLAHLTAPISLRPYQAQAIDNVEQAWAQGHHSVLLHGPTGTGKSVQAGELIARHLNRPQATVLVIAHRLSLLDQMQAHLIRQGVPASDIGILDAGRVPAPSARVLIASVQSVSRKIGSDEVAGWRPGPDLLIVVDEAHRATAPTYKKVYALPHSRRLGLTATPSREAGDPLDRAFDVLISSTGFAERFDAGDLLRPVYYTAPGWTPEEFEDSQRKLRAAIRSAASTGLGIPEKVADELMNRPVLVKEVAAHLKELTREHLTIVAASSIAHADHIASAAQRIGVSCASLNSLLNKAERAKVMSDFSSGKIRAIIAVDMLTEGVDLPMCSALIVARPIGSLNFWVQLVGRPMRPSGGMTEFIVADHSGTLAVLGRAEDYDQQYWLEHWMEVRSMRAETQHAMSLAAAPRTCRCGHEWTGGPVCPNCRKVAASLKFLEENAQAREAEVPLVKAAPSKLSRLSTTKVPMDQLLEEVFGLLSAAARRSFYGQLCDLAIRQGVGLSQARMRYTAIVGKRPSPGWAGIVPVTPEVESFLRLWKLGVRAVPLDIYTKLQGALPDPDARSVSDRSASMIKGLALTPIKRPETFAELRTWSPEARMSMFAQLVSYCVHKRVRVYPEEFFDHPKAWYHQIFGEAWTGPLDEEWGRFVSYLPTDSWVSSLIVQLRKDPRYVELRVGAGQAGRVPEQPAFAQVAQSSLAALQSSESALPASAPDNLRTLTAPQRLTLMSEMMWYASNKTRSQKVGQAYYWFRELIGESPSRVPQASSCTPWLEKLLAEHVRDVRRRFLS